MAAPTETKVTVAGVSSSITSFVMAYIALNWGALPDAVSTPGAALLLAAVTGVLTYGSAWWAKHTNRTDPDAVKGKHV
jgi:ABC-type Fe3+-siderophore transport system permease subunit